MRKTVQTIFFALFASVVVAQAQPVQKIGYLNAQAILVDMPEMKGADSKLEAFAKQMQAKDSIMVVGFQMKVKAFQEAVEKGLKAPIEQEQEKKKLEAEQLEIQKFEQDMQQQMAQKRQTEYQPILDKVNKAISEIAKENGFTYVIDATAGSLLFADEKNDLQNLVRKKLGLKEAAATVVGKQ